jgi:hypothetical protein
VLFGNCLMAARARAPARQAGGFVCQRWRGHAVRTRHEATLLAHDQLLVGSQT